MLNFEHIHCFPFHATIRYVWAEGSGCASVDLATLPSHGENCGGKKHPFAAVIV